ncbi:MAG: right-handed parallel beta-helix repeat-containing protein, partial [Duncaniella sp.]|nr:right-handed parallel beta-helix repeat-containing protein [Duncaniella sp.]
VSTDGVTTWNQIGTTKVSSSSTYGSSSHATNAAATDNCIIRFTAKSATIYVDDIDISYVNSASEPGAQAKFTAGNVTGSSVDLDITPGDGEGRLVAYCEGQELTWAPVDGVDFREPFPRKDGTAVIVASGNVGDMTVTDLKPGTQYTFGVWEYNGDGEARNYLKEGVTPVTVTTLQVPVLTVVPSAVDFYNTKVGGHKDITVNLLGLYLEPAAGTVTVTADNGSVTFATQPDGQFANTLSVNYAEATLDAQIVVRFSPSESGLYDMKVNVNGGGASCTLALTGKGADNDSREIVIAPDGNDNGAGTFEEPWLNLQKAVNEAQPGDIIYCRGGRYHFTTRDSSGKLTVRIKNSGTAEAPITIRAYGDEHPIFDFEQQLIDCNRDRSKVGDRGIQLTGNYWHLYGLHITHAADNGIKLEGSHNRIERCEFSYNLDSGIQLGFGHNFSDSGLGSKNDGSFCAYNDIIDCDSHHNCDYDANYGSDADGFACKMHNGKGNRFIRCRAWRNSDDAWDLYETDFSVTLIECWAWESGKAEDHTWVYD